MKDIKAFFALSRRSVGFVLGMMFVFGASTASAQVKVHVHGNVYGGGNQAPVSRGTTVLIDQSGAVIGGAVYGGGALAKVDTFLIANPGSATSDDSTLVTILRGTIDGNIYGGGLGDSVPAPYNGTANVAAHVYGGVHVRIGQSTTSNGDTVVSGSATINGAVYGCNNLNGSPQKNVFVDIFQTAHTSANTYPAGITTLEQLAAAPNTADNYAIEAVYGGGNMASYTAVGCTTTVHIYTCVNTIQTAYGGGNAADATNVKLIIDGGRFDQVFGGGNGYSSTHNHSDASQPNYNPGADITGSATTEIHGGLYRQLFGGSNQYGDVANASLSIDDASGCNEVILESFGGANEAPITGNVTTNLLCSNIQIGSFYGGSNMADINGNVTLNVYGGTYTNVFGGSKGRIGNTPADSANITGNVTLNLFGGTMTNAFGGSDQNGNITGSVTVNMLDFETATCGLQVNNVYGGGNLTAYTPDDATISSPTVNIIHGSVTKDGLGNGGNVFGGGYGDGATVTANPVVNIGYDATLMGAADDINSLLYSLLNNSNPNITYTPAVADPANYAATVGTNVFGGGEEAAVAGSTTVTIRKANTTVTEDVYGGGALAATGSTTVTLDGGTVRDIYGGGLGDGSTAAAVNGNTVVTVNGGTVRDVFGCNNDNGAPTGTVTVNINSSVTRNVYGGGNLAAYTAPSGSYPAVNINNGTVGGSVFGGGNGDPNDNTATTAMVTGNPIVTIGDNDAGHSAIVTGNVYGGGNAAKVTGNTHVIYNDNGSSTAVAQLFGGGNAAGVTGTADVDMTLGHVTGGIYGGCNSQGNVVGNITVDVTGGTVGTSSSSRANIHGGGYGPATTTDGTVTVNIASLGAASGPTIYGDIYGGSGFGEVSATDLLTQVNFYKGTVNGDIYGGGLGRAAVEDDPATPADETVVGIAAIVSGNVQVNIRGGVFNAADGTAGGGMVFGANNAYGTPLGNVAVNIYGTDHGSGIANNEYPLPYGSISTASALATNAATQTYAIAAVYGGGNLASYIPAASKSASVHVYNCDNTIRDVYGGGNAANVGTSSVSTNTSVTIDGGRIHRVFGGGNGEVTPANTYGTATTTVNAGLIDQVFGCGNMQGSITATDLQLLKSGSCTDEVLGEVFGGANMAVISSDLSTTIGCGVGAIGDIYGGSNKASITGDVSLTINGGTYTNVFGGSKGIRGNGSTIEDTAANISGKVTLNLHGGTIGNAFGGSNQNGSIGDSIIVNVLDFNTACPLNVTNIYGGGNETPYSPTNSSLTSPIVNVMHIAQSGGILGNVYGGGKGSTALVTANPKVTIGYDASTMSKYTDGHAVNADTLVAYVTGNVFGGGDAAPVTGNTTVLMQKSNSHAAALFGGGNVAAVDGGTTVTMNNGTTANIYGGGNEAGVTGTTSVTLAAGTVSTGIYGGCNTSGTVGGDIEVDIEANVGTSLSSVSIYGGGYGSSTFTDGDITVTIGSSSIPTIYGDIYGGSALGEVGASGTIAKVDFQNGTLNGSIYGGGMGQNSSSTSAIVTGGTEVAISGGSISGSIYGGCNERGNVVEDITVSVTGGTIGANGSPASVFGGGYGANTTTQGDVEVNINGASVTVWGDVYGGSGFGDVNSDGNDATTVNILNGEVKQDVFGGGLGSTSPAYAAAVNGVVTVNIGSDNGDGTYSGNALIGGNVYGCNNTNGSPQQDVTVNIYATAHPSGTLVGESGYALANVFGGGKNADFNASGKKTYVNVYSCANTIQDLFGGGDAAAVTGTEVMIQGGRFERVFGGGNGEVTAANVGTGGITLDLHGGTIGTLVSASNQRGAISGDINVNVDNVGGCTEVVEDFFGGANMVNIGTNENPVDVVTTIECGAGTFTNVYGGSNKANIIGNVVLNVKGGTMQNVFGGSKGVRADGGAILDTAANITGNVTLNLYGGTVRQDAFGGSNQSGNITGNITVNVLDHEGTCALDVNNIYGGGNVTAYTPTNASATSPTINVMHINQSAGIRGNIYGGGKGLTAVVTANPRVNIGYDATTMNNLPDVEYPAGMDPASHYIVKVSGSVFGGGNQAATNGSPIVKLEHFNSVVTNLYGGGNEAGIRDHTTITMNNGTVTDGIYGGCNTSGTVGGNSTVDLIGGTVGSVDNNARVFGGGFGQSTNVDGNVHVTLGNLALTATPTLYGNLYGGSALGNVNTKATDGHMDGHNMNTVETTTIDILSGTVVGNIFGGGLGQKNGVNGATSDITPIVHGKIQVNIGYESGGDYYGDAVLRNASVYGCNNLNGTPQNDVFIDIYSTHREASDEVGVTEDPTYAIANVYGGGNRADYAPTEIYRKDWATINAYLNSQGIEVNDSTRRPFVKKPHIYIYGCENTIGELFAGGNAAAVPGDSLVFDGGRFNEVFGGGNGALIPANVGVGGVFLEGRGGFCGFIYEHCNKRGTVSGSVTFVSGSGVVSDCNNGILKVHNHFCGGNEVDVMGDFVHTYTCLDNLDYNALYGGCRLGTTYGNITLIIEGGHFGTIFGGPKGDPDFAASVKKYPTSAEIAADQALPAADRKFTQAMVDHMNANPSLEGTGGNVTIILRGGTVGTVYGGCDANGNVEGRITIIVDSLGTGCGFELNNIYGGGNLAAYNPDTADSSDPNYDPNYQFPLIDLRNGHVNNNVYGGGRGNNLSTSNGLVTSNPYVHMHPDVANSKKFLVKGNIYGGGELGQVQGNTVVRIENGTVKGTVYGGGKGNQSHEGFGLIAKNTWVDMQGGLVGRSVYGGGELGSVGTFIDFYTAGNGRVAGEPKTCQAGTGVAKVIITDNAQVGVVEKARIPYPSPDDDDLGYVFGGSRGEIDSIHYPNANKLAVVDSTYLEIGGNALLTASVYGGCENGQVLRNTYVKITGDCQIGVGYHKEGENHIFDPVYTTAQWEAENPAVFHECSHFPYRSPHEYYDPYAEFDGYYDDGHTQSSQGGNSNATNGASFYGNVFGGGCGYYAIEPGDGVAPGTWRRAAGRVNGNTRVDVDGGHILTNLYGGNEMTDVLGSCTVNFSGGTLGVPRTRDSILAHPVTCYLFGAGKGDPRTLFNDMTNVGSVTVNVTGGRIYGSVFGGGEDGHVLGNVTVNISGNEGTNAQAIAGTATKIGTLGTSYVDGNVFGAGRGFTGLALTAGTVCGNVEVNISGGTMLGSIYGGGRLGSVGYKLCYPSDDCYGVMTTHADSGNIVVNITGGTIGNDDPADYNLAHSRGGNVFGGSMGRLTKLDGTMVLPIWHKLGSAKSTTVNIDGRTNPVRIKGNVYGGSELGTVTENITVDIQGDVIVGRNAAGSTSHGNVYGGGFGHPELTAAQRAEVGNDATSDSIPTFAGLTGGTIQVNISGGAINNNVYGGGELASVGTISSVIKHTDPNTSYYLSWPYEYTYNGTSGDARVTITGGTIGFISGGDTTGGNVYGSARGTVGDRYVTGRLATARVTHVDINLSDPAYKIIGDVYGSGENGHVYDSAVVTLRNGLVLGNVFGGGKGVDTYTDQLKDPDDDHLYDADVYDIIAGKVFGNTYVNILGGRVEKNVYGGGNLASVGIGNYKGYGEGTNVLQADSLLAENSGHCYVTILGGIVGPDSLVHGTASRGAYAVTTGNVYGAGKGIVFPAAPKEGYDYGRDYFMACVNKTTVIFGDSTQRSCAASILYPQATGEVFGGGENGRVRFDTYVQTNRGQIGVRPLASSLSSDVGHWNNRGNVFGAGRGEDKNTDGTYCQSAGHVGRNTTIDILGGRIYRNVQGGGSMAAVGPFKGQTGDSSTCVINVRLPQVDDTLGGPAVTGNNFGGYLGGGSRGIPSRDGKDSSMLATCHNSQINFYQGRLKNTIYGGGENGQMLGNTEVNIYGGYIRSAVYAGGKGSWMAPVSEQYFPGDYSEDTLSGYVYGNTLLNALGGQLPFLYGGCRRASVGGNATVNIGKDNGDGTYSGEASFIVGKDKVYGGNQYVGSPRGNIYVNVYKTAHTLTDVVSGTDYAINFVYGGSYNSPYLPHDSGHFAQVHIYGCENTIDSVYGGCAAANVGAKPGIGASTKLIIDGGRFNAVFGGGDGSFDRYLGHAVPANIYGAATTEIHGGTIGSLYGGSNFMGQADTIRISVDTDGPCGNTVEGDEFFGGSNLSDLGTPLNPTVLSTTLGCGVNFRAAYGGSNQADIIGDVTLIIEGGEFNEVYGGSKGAIVAPSASDGMKDTVKADIDGNTHLTILGGKIHNAFGGSNINGNITGTITVDIDSTYNTCDYQVVNVYGGSNLTQYTPNATSTPTPLVNILCGTVDSNVFGGGKGTNTDFSAGLVTSNPKVTMSQTAKGNTWVKGDIYGGGEMASVGVFTRDANDSITVSVADSGNTWVVITGGTVGPNSVSPTANDIKGHVFGGCLGKAGHVGNPGDPGYVNYANFAYVNTARVDISGTSHVRGSVFGGGENGHVFDSTLVNIEGGTVGNGIYRDEYAWLNPITGNVYGGGRGLDLSTDHTLNITAGWVRGATHVLVSGGHIHHNVYGGGSMASVGPRRNDVGYNNTYGLGDHNGRTWVEVTGGLIGICIDSTDRDQNYYGSVYGAGRGRSGVDIDYGNDWAGFTFVHNAKVIINYSNTALANVATETAYGTQHITGNVYGGGFNGHVNNSTSVTITRGRIGSHGAMNYGSLEGNVFGGGCGEEPFKAYLVRDGYYITNAQLASGTGHTDIPYSKSDRSAIETYYSTARSHNDSLAVTDSLSPTAGLVYGDATVLINGATRNDVLVKHHVYGGGSMASVGDYWIYPATVGSGADETETEGEVYPLTANNRHGCPTNHAGSNTATGICTVTITGGTFGTTGGNNGMIFGGCRGLEGNLTDITNAMAYFNDAHVTLGTTSTLVDYANPQILVNGSIYGGGENGHATGSTYVTIHDGKIGNHASEYDRIKTIDDKVEEGTATDAEKREMDSLLVIASNCGNVYGGGCGTDKYHDSDTIVTRVIGGTLTTLKSVVNPANDSLEAVYRYNPYCGVVYGNTNVVIDGGYVEHNVYGGGSMANVGRRVGLMIPHTDVSNSFALSWPVEVTVRRGTGYTNVTVSGNARIGYSGSDNGDIFGGARGEAGDRYEMARYANVYSTNVTVDIPMPGGYDYTKTEKQIKNNVIKQYGTLVPLVAGSVYGGSENGQVINNTTLTLTNGIVGHSIYGGGKGKGTYVSHHLKYKVADGVHSVGDDSTATIYSLTAGKVFGNTAVTMTAGHVVRNIYGGGNLGSIGKGNYAGGVGDYSNAGYGERWPDGNAGMRDSLVNSGHAIVAVNGGYVGTFGSTKDGLPTGNVFGGARGEAAPNDNTSPRYLYTPAYFLGYVNHTTVTIGSSVGSNATPQIYGSVYGGGEDGHVRGNTVVTVNDGVIGCQYNSTNIALQGDISDKENIQWKLRGNVFGAGSGLGQYTDKNGDLQYNNASGSVSDSSVVFINGGQVARNVYGGGSFATVGPPKIPPITDDPTYAQSHSRVIVSGGTVGYTPTDLDDTTTFYGGDVFGAGRGLASDTYKGYCNVPHTYVNIAGTVRGNVYGGGEDGHVVGDTRVNITTGAAVGVGGTIYLDGSVFGGGKGSGEAIDHDSDPGTPDEYRINKTCGRVGGNTTVTMDNGMIHGSLFGGGQLALTGVDANGEYTSFVTSTLYDSINHGLATVTVTGGTIGTSAPDTLLMCDWSTGDIMGSGKGDIDNYEDVLAGRVANTVVTVSGSPVVRGSVFGGGEMASVGYWPDDNGHSYVPQTGTATVNVTGGTIGLAYEYTVDPDDNPGSWTIYNDDKDTLIHTCTGNIFGGSQGDVDITAPHWISMGRARQTSVTVGGTAAVLGKVFGGSEQGIVNENTHVIINGGTFGIDAPAISITPNAQIAKHYSGDIYAAGYGSDDPDEWDDDTPNDSTAGSIVMGLGWSTGLLSGRTFGNSQVDILGGTIYGSVYGGGSFASVGDDKSMSTMYTTSDYPVNGVTTVNIGLPGVDPTDASLATGSATINGEVFGGNNFKGTPYGNTNVHIYKTDHTVANTCPSNDDANGDGVGDWASLATPNDELTREDVLALSDADNAFAIKSVYGGGNRAAHAPLASDGTTLVHVHYCDENTIHSVYGGGNAANTNNNHIIIDGGYIYEVFGGGNGAGAGNPGADVAGTAWTEIRGGLITNVYGGSNSKGYVTNTRLEIDKGTCDMMVANTYGGGNEAFGGGGVITVSCGTKMGNFYGGSRMANIKGDIILNITGGTFENVFGGSLGTTTTPANIDGNVIVNVTGGHIGKLYGGSDVNGYITGQIIVNVDLDPDYNCADGLLLDTVYGGSNLAIYTPDDPTLSSPMVNIINDSCANGKTFALKTVFGGSYGNGTNLIDAVAVHGDTLTGYIKSNPTVNFGGHDHKIDLEHGPQPVGFVVPDPHRRNMALVRHNIYGGGQAGPVEGNTEVIVYSSRITAISGSDTTFATHDHDTAHVAGSVYGGGSGQTAKVTGNTTVGIYGDATVIEGNVYGGGEAAILEGSTDVQIGYEMYFICNQPTIHIDGTTGEATIFSSTPGTVIYYVIDGSVTYNSDGNVSNLGSLTLYDPAHKPTVDAGETIKAVAVRNVCQHTAPGIEINKTTGEVTLTTLMPDATIYYMITNNANAKFTYVDGVPTNGTVYYPSSKPTISDGQYIKAVVVDSHYKDSLPGTATR